MKKNIAIFTGGLVIGIVLSAIIVLSYIMPRNASSMFMLQEQEIVKQGEEAYKAYLHEETPVSIWALERYVDALNRIIEERTSADVDDPYFMLHPEIDLVLAHGRLGILYRGDDNIEKSQYHFNQALSYAAKRDKNYIRTEEELISYLRQIDSIQLKKDRY